MWLGPRTEMMSLGFFISGFWLCPLCLCLSQMSSLRELGRLVYGSSRHYPQNVSYKREIDTRPSSCQISNLKED